MRTVNFKNILHMSQVTPFVAHHQMPPFASGAPPHGCPGDRGWSTSYIICRWWTTGGPSVAISGKSHPPIAAGVPLVVHQCFFAAHSHWWTIGVMLSEKSPHFTVAVIAIHTSTTNNPFHGKYFTISRIKFNKSNSSVYS